MTWICGVSVLVWLSFVCAFGWAMWVIGQFQGRRAMRRQLRKTLNRAGSRFGEEL